MDIIVPVPNPVGDSEVGASSVAALAVSMQNLQRVTEVGFTKVEGQLDLVNEKLRQASTEQVTLKQKVDSNTTRILAVEKDYVTRSTLYKLLGLMVAILTAIGAIVDLWIRIG